MTIERTPWGAVDDQSVHLFTLTNPDGLVARITNYGAIVVELHAPDREGRLGDIALGFGSLDEYVRTPKYFGATVGRVGNRIANATFELGGRRYDLSANHGPNHLHGGRIGWDKRVWDAEAAETRDGPSLMLALRSPDGEEGYPGTVHATTRYTLTDANELAIEMTATTDHTTIVNMVHHTYFNLGRIGGDILDHQLQLFADAYTPGMPPDGRVVRVDGTPFDFTQPKPIGRDHEAAGSAGGGAPAGYDSNWIVNGELTALRPVARLFEPVSGRLMTLRSNQPGVQFYSGVFLDGTTGGKGRRHTTLSGLCLEPQAFPNAINVPAWRNQVILAPGQTYRHETVFSFGADTMREPTE
jgi:aldose 1-epimerase